MVVGKKYQSVTTLAHAKQVIAEQDRMIGELTRKCNSLEDSQSRREQWLRQAKKEAGYDNNESFDKVWAETLALAKRPEN